MWGVVRAFSCDVCAAQLYFENSVCLTCGSPVAYSRTARRLVVLGPGGGPGCVNLNLNGCNWLADPSSAAGLCFSCSLTRTRPADTDVRGLAGYFVAEGAKRRLVFGLDELALPVVVSDGFVGLAFDLLSNEAGPVVTGYHNGVITLDLAEADDAHRESLRVSLDEPYRTVLGHLRHEIGHYYFEVLVAGDRLTRFRGLFGDERASYPDALARHYRQGPPPGWQESHLSAYASVHPWEDFAESFAHYLHIVDTVQTAGAFGVGPASVDHDRPFPEVVAETWLPLTAGLNQINRSMGRPDLYPFVLGPTVLAKLAFVSDLVAASKSAPD